MQEARFEVQGSADEPYRVHFVRSEDGNLSAYCTCPAGENGQYCKHRFRILDGVTKDIVSGNEREVAVVAGWLPGSDVERAMEVVAQAEKEAASAKRSLSQAKKLLATAMRD